MTRLNPPRNHWNIITPMLSTNVRLKRCADVYPHEFVGRSVIVPCREERRYTVELYPVTSTSHYRARDATEVIAYYFRREFDYDMTGYHADETQDRRDRIFLLLAGDCLSREREGVGAIAFRWKEYSDAPHQLVLDWVWIHPFLRRSGVFTAYWDIFREVYGNFRVELPYSKAMHSFLAKMNALSC